MSNDSLLSEQTGHKKIPQRWLVVMVLLTFVILGGAWIFKSRLRGGAFGVTSLTLPKRGQKIWKKNQDPIRFEWVGKASSDSFLQVSRDRDFHDLVLEVEDPKSPFLTDKLPGDEDYFYRITEDPSGPDQAGLEPIAFTIVSQSPPQLIYPFTPMSFSEAKPLRFYWQKEHAVNHYRFQIAFDNAFEKILSNLLLDETQTGPQTIPSGQFFWRVRGEDDSTDTTLWSEVRVLQSERVLSKIANEQVTNSLFRAPASPAPPVAAVKTAPKASPLIVKAPPEKTLASPQLVSTVQVSLLRFQSGKSHRNPASLQKSLLNPPTLKWPRSKGATSYEVQISKKSDFLPLEWNKNISTLETKWNQAAPGKFFWRVRALDGSGSQSPFSSSSSLDLKLPAPKMKKLFSHVMQIKKRSQFLEQSPVPLSWPEVPAASGYRVLVSENKKFRSAIVDLKVERNLASLKLDQEGRYFVKVAALGSAGETVSEFSEVATVDYQRKNLIPAPPASRAPSLQAAVVPPTEDKISIPTPQLKLPPNGVSIVSMNESQDPILFKWINTDADVYHIEIAADEGFQQILHSAEVKDNQLVITKALPKGKLYWRLRAQKGADKSDWSPTFSFEFAK